MTTLVLEPLIPIALWGSLALGAVALLSWYVVDCARRLGRPAAGRVAALMGLSVALPLFVLLNPTWHERIPPPAGKPVLTVLVDASASMATRDMADDGSRFDEARRIAEALAARLSDRFEIQLQTFSQASAAVEAGGLEKISPQGPFTDLTAALGGVLQSDRPQGQAVVLLSDGIHNVSGEAAVVTVAQRARALTVPIYAKTLGGLANVRDLAVEVHTPQDLAFVAQRIPIRVELVAQGLAGAVARVTLVDDEREVDRREVILAAEATAQLEFPLRHDKSGVFRYEVRVAPLEGEVTEVNNACTYVLRVVDEPIRVLLLEGKPYWDTKFLLRALGSDPSIELVSVVRMAEGRYLQRTLRRPAAQTAAADEPATGAPLSQAPHDKPANVEERNESWRILPDVGEVLSGATLGSFQIVVLGRDAEAYLTDDVIAEFKRWLARDGGSLVCFRGTPTVQVSERLAPLLPVRSTTSRETRFHVQLTEAGRALRWIGAPQTPEQPDSLSRLPSLARRTESAGTHPLAIVWAVGESASGEQSPVVTSMPYGTGRVVVIEGAGMWRWAFLAPQYDDQQQLYAALWQSLTRWLVSNTGLLPAQQWALRADKVRFASTEPATASLLVRQSALADGPPKIELSGATLPQPRSFVPLASGDELGAYRVLFGQLPEGRYQAVVAGSPQRDSAARAIFDVRSNVDEFLRLSANVNLMARLAQASGGAVLDDASPQEVAARVDEHLARWRPERVQSTTAWDRWWVLVGVFGVWSVAWGVRRRRGLV
ncbi:MAG: hypothetical protein WD063_12825 [Pirellulales bacterium]